MRKLGKKNAVSDGTMVAFACPCDCTSLCNAGANSCTTCIDEGAMYGLQAVNKGRASNYGGNSLFNQLQGM